MAITDHVSILVQFALAAAVPNKKKPTKPHQFYAVIAFPPEAMGDLQEMCAKAATPTFGSLRPGLRLGITKNAARPQPYPGIPGDWFIVRAASNYAPDIYTARGDLVSRADPAGLEAIKTTFYAGKKVRALIDGWAWTEEGGGVSYNLFGVMDAGTGGDRLAIGGPDSNAAFAKHANPNAAAPSTVSQSPGSAQGNPFGTTTAQPTNTQPAAAQGNPFGGAGAAGGDPFAQATGGAAANPFG